MKKFHSVVMIFLYLAVSSNQLFAQTPCTRVAAETFSLNEQTYGVRVRLEQTFDQAVTVNGLIYEAGRNNIDGFTLTIAAGSLTAETGADYYRPESSKTVISELRSFYPSTVNKYRVTYNLSAQCAVTDYNGLAIQHNDALDYIHLTYSTGGPYNFQAVYNGIVKYCNVNKRPLPALSYDELINIKKQVTDVSSLLNVMQRQYSAVTENEKNEINMLYQNLNSATSDAGIEVVLQDFNTSIHNSSYSANEKNKLLAVSSTLFTIGDFWSSTENFMGAPEETRTWTQRMNSDLPMAYSDIYRFNPVNTFKGPYIETNQVHSHLKKCRLLCVLCVAAHDAIMFAILSGINPPGAPYGAAAWSLIARCCFCGKCGNVNCWNE